MVKNFFCTVGKLLEALAITLTAEISLKAWANFFWVGFDLCSCTRNVRNCHKKRTLQFCDAELVSLAEGQRNKKIMLRFKTIAEVKS